VTRSTGPLSLSSGAFVGALVNSVRTDPLSTPAKVSALENEVGPRLHIVNHFYTYGQAVGTQGAVQDIRVQQDVLGHRGRSGDPLYAARPTLHTGADLLTDKQKDRLTALFATDVHIEVEATWGAYREPDRTRGRALMQTLIESVSHGVPAASTELITLCRTLKSAPTTCWPTSTAPARATVRPRPSTADSNTSAAPSSDSATSPTTSPDRCWRPAASDPDYTLDHEEPRNR